MKLAQNRIRCAMAEVFAVSRTCHRILLGLVEERERLRSSTTPVPMLVLMLDVLTSPGVPVGGAGGAAPCLCKACETSSLCRAGG
jgi:hypothetical protein